MKQKKNWIDHSLYSSKTSEKNLYDQLNSRQTAYGAKQRITFQYWYCNIAIYLPILVSPYSPVILQDLTPQQHPSLFPVQFLSTKKQDEIANFPNKWFATSSASSVSGKACRFWGLLNLMFFSKA